MAKFRSQTLCVVKQSKESRVALSGGGGRLNWSGRAGERLIGR